MPLKYRKKPVVVEAMRWTGKNIEEAAAFMGVKDWRRLTWHDYCVHIRTLEGEMIASQGDFIIKGVAGEIYPCKPDIFEATYEPVEDES